MSYVVGFIGDDGSLGRTFFAANDEQVRSALRELHEENGDFFEEDNEWWDNECVFDVDYGSYFVGGLETLEDVEEVSKKNS